MQYSPPVGSEGRIGCWFVFDAHKAVSDAQLPSSRFRRASQASTKKVDVKLLLLQQSNPKTIANIKALAQIPLGGEPEAPVGQRPAPAAKSFQAALQHPPAQLAQCPGSIGRCSG